MVKRLFGIVAVVLILGVVAMVILTPSKSLCFKKNGIRTVVQCDTVSSEDPMNLIKDSVRGDSIF